MVNLKSVFLSLIGLFVLISCGTEPTPTYQLTTSVVGNGSVSPSNGQFDEGESVTITSTPDSGWVFSNWEGDWTSSQTPATITMDRDKTIIGVFERKDYPLNITIGEGEGSVSERVVSQPKVTDYPFETVVELTPVPANEWWVFSSWSGDITSDQQVVEVTVNGETNVILNFEFTGNSYFVKTYEYDSNNNMTKESQYYSGTISSWTDYFYDSDQNLIDSKYYLSNGTLVDRNVYEYDLDNKLIKRTRRYGGGVIVTDYSYDSNDRLIEESKYGEKITYSYDSQGNLIEKIWINTLNQEVKKRNIYEYDSSNNLVKWTFDDNTEVTRVHTYEYDSSNNLTKYIFYFNNQEYEIHTYYYDIENNLIEYEREYKDENCTIQCYVRYTYEYDSDNKLVKTSLYESDIIINFTKYNFDSNNNLIEEVRYEYQKGKIVSNRKQTDPLNELCNQLDLPEQQVPMLCED